MEEGNIRQGEYPAIYLIEDWIRNRVSFLLEDWIREKH